MERDPYAPIFKSPRAHSLVTAQAASIHRRAPRLRAVPQSPHDLGISPAAPNDGGLTGKLLRWFAGKPAVSREMPPTP